MPGRDFLILYGLVIAATVVCVFWRKRSLHASQRHDLEDLPGIVKPLDLAFLRGNVQEVP
jgi:hypothetical protein